jgi:TetR/AcrR family transcriptional regulator
VTVSFRRAEILRAAEREFVAAGFAGGRIERIAASAGVNKQLLFHYFDSKERLFTAALEGLLRDAEPETQPNRSPAEELRLMVDALRRSAASRPGLVAIVADAESERACPMPARELVRAWRGRLVARLAAALAEGQRRGYFRDDLDPASVAKLALAMALGAGTLGPGEPHDLAGRFLAEACAWR